MKIQTIVEANQLIHQYLPFSPLLQNAWLSDFFQCEIYLKLENMQPIGSFKIRGALNKISQLSAEEKSRGVVAASAGNHAQGVAWASRRLGVKALIVMPKTAPLVKVQNTQALGAEIRLEGDNYDEAFAVAQKIASETKRVYVHAFDDALVVAGQGTCGLEILEQLPDVDYIIASIGGGGLVAGISVVSNSLKPSCKVIGAQALGAASMMESIKQGHTIKLDKVQTFADGIAVSQAKDLTFSLIQKYCHKILAADDEQIAASVLTLLEKAKIVSEGAAAVSLAVLEQMRSEIKGKKVCIVIGGGNIDVNVLNRIIDRGLIQNGRRLRVNVTISDRPGSLASLTAKIAELGANIIQAIHDRSEPTITIDKTEVQLTLETRGHEHSAEVIEGLRSVVLKVEMIK